MTDLDLKMSPAKTGEPNAGAVRLLERMQDSGKLLGQWWMVQEVWSFLERMCERFAKSDMVPKAYQGAPGNVFVALSAGLPLGLSPLACLQSVAVINGMPKLYGDAPLALVLAHESLLEYKETESGTIEDDDRCWTVLIKRRTKSGATITVERSYSVEDAKRAKLWGKMSLDGTKTTPWVTFPDRMLLARAKTFACRDAFGDVLQGIGIGDIDDEVGERIIQADAKVTTAAPAAVPEDDTKVRTTDDGFDDPAPTKRNSRHTKKQPKEPRTGDTWAGDGGLYVMTRNGPMLWSTLQVDDIDHIEAHVNTHAQLIEAFIVRRDELDEMEKPVAPAAEGAAASAKSSEPKIINLAERLRMSNDLPAWATVDALQGKLQSVEDGKGKERAVWCLTKTAGDAGLPAGKDGDVMFRLLPGAASRPQLLEYKGGVWSLAFDQRDATLEDLVKKAMGRSITNVLKRANLTADKALAIALDDKVCCEEAFKTWADMTCRTMVLVRARLWHHLQVAEGGAK